MSSIIIREKDITSAGSPTVVKAVYVPGYANKGEINVPTLIQTPIEFKEVFGTAPYVFKYGSEYPSFKFGGSSAKPTAYKAGDYEKSWIYAMECLQKGLPVVYERVFDESKLEDWLATSTIADAVADTSIEGDIVADVKIKDTAYVGAIGASASSQLEITQVAPPDDAHNKSTVFQIRVSIGDKSESQQFVFNSRDDFPAPQTVLYTELSNYLTLVDIEWKTSFINKVNTAIDNQEIATVLLYDGVRYFSLEPHAEDEFQVMDVYNHVNDSYDALTDRDEYDIMFVTSGAYPTFLVYENGAVNTTYTANLMSCAATRHDAVALVDFANLDYDLTGNDSIYGYVNTNQYFPNVTSDDALGEDASIYSTLFTPTTITSCTSVNKDLIMPASLTYLLNFASSSGQNPDWFAVAGGKRGPAINLVNTVQRVTGNIANKVYQQRTGRSINPIYTVKPYGKCLWGNRTLRNNSEGLVAQSFLNIRILCCVLKKVIYKACKSLTFEQNDDVLWTDFKSKISPTLKDMLANRGIRGYEIKKTESDVKGQVKGYIKIIPIEAVEDFDITVVLADSLVEVSE